MHTVTRMRNAQFLCMFVIHLYMNVNVCVLFSNVLAQCLSLIRCVRVCAAGCVFSIASNTAKSLEKKTIIRCATCCFALCFVYIAAVGCATRSTIRFAYGILLRRGLQNVANHIVGLFFKQYISFLFRRESTIRFRMFCEPRVGGSAISKSYSWQVRAVASLNMHARLGESVNNKSYS